MVVENEPQIILLRKVDWRREDKNGGKEAVNANWTGGGSEGVILNEKILLSFLIIRIPWELLKVLKMTNRERPLASVRPCDSRIRVSITATTRWTLCSERVVVRSLSLSISLQWKFIICAPEMAREETALLLWLNWWWGIHAVDTRPQITQT